MSSSVYSQQNPSPIQTRRAPIKNNDIENNSQRHNNARSLSSKFRNLFRKSSSSPNPSTYNDRLPPPAPSRQRSPSPGSVRISTEAPHIRAPIFNWPFGKKTTKTKGKRKTKKPSAPFMEISSPTYQQEYQTSIRGQNFVPRTPEHTHVGIGRTQSSSSYDTTTKGFRDYMIIDNTKSSQKIIAPRVDAVTPPPYTSDHSRSPSLHHHRLPDTNIEYSYHRDTSPPISDIETFRLPKQQTTLGATSSLTTTQILAGKTPLLPSTVTQPINISTNSNQWKNTSYSSLNNAELRSTTSSLKDIDIPKLNAPLIPLGSPSSKRELKLTNSQFRHGETYNSSSTVNDFLPSNQSYTRTYGSSLTDTDTIPNDNLTSLTSTKSNSNQYPGLIAIIEHHIRPISVHFEERSPITTTTSTKQIPRSPTTTPRSLTTTPRSPTTTPSLDQTKRFDVSTTTLDEDDDDQQQQQQWSATITNGSATSASAIHHHDGYIRPLTPQKPFVQPDVSMIHINLDDLRGQSPSRTSYYNSTDSPIMYRSSTVIYTKDKYKYPQDSGELRTWSIQGNDDIDKNTKPSTSIKIVPSNLTNEQEDKYAYEYEQHHQQEYSNNLYSNINDSRLIRSSIINERDKIYNPLTRSYTQESRNTITPDENYEVALRHYTLKRSNSYDGLGILISADTETHLNARIRDVENGSPGSRAGLRKNDRIINVNGTNVENVDFGDVLVLIKEGLNNNNLQISVIDESIL